MAEIESQGVLSFPIYFCECAYLIADMGISVSGDRPPLRDTGVGVPLY